MLTTLVLVFAVLLVVASVFMMVQALRGNFFATVWVCCGGLSASVEVVGTILAAVIAGIADATKG